jgi:AcrR family transcriptional regulator
MVTDDKRLQARKTPRQARAELTRRRILTAAAHVFADHGYAAGTTNRIAERAGISIGSLYQYYPGKDAILAELVGSHLERGKVSQQAWDAAPAAPLSEVLRSYVHSAVDNHRDDPQLLQVILEQAPRWPALLPQITQYHQAEVRAVQHALERHPEVLVADTGTAAQLVVTTVELVVHWLTAGGAVTPAALEDELVAMLDRYLTAAGTH